MSLLASVKTQLLQQHAYRAGKVPVNFLRGFFQAIEKQQGHGIKVPDLALSVHAALSSTAATPLNAAGRVYGLQIKSPSAAAADVLVIVLDNTATLASFRVTKGQAAEVYFCGGNDGIGIPAGTSIKVKAVAVADETSAPSSGDRPDVVVIYGADATNTE